MHSSKRRINKMGKKKEKAVTAIAAVDEVNSLLMMAVRPRLTRRQWLTLFAIGSVHFSSAICISLQAPFYPHEAELKGATASEYGLVFGSFELVACLTGPFLGNHVNTFGVKRLLNVGMIVAATAAILFGMLDFVMEHYMFITLSFVLRVIESLGSTSALVSAFSITAAVFPESVGTTFAALEVFYGVGYIAGPTIGGFLFTLGGFKLPFVVNGLLMLVVAIAVIYILPPFANDSLPTDKGVTFLSVLRVPSVLLNCICIVATSISMGYLSATLEPHLRQFELTPITMGFIFIISGGTYAVVAPFVGRLCDKWFYPSSVICIGSLLIVVSFSIVGPAPFVPLPTTLRLCIVGLVIHGFGLACLMVPTFIDSIRSAVGAGFPDNISTYGILSGLWASAFALGAFIGPSVAGLLFDNVGFRNGTLFVIAIHSILFILCTTLNILRKRRISSKRLWLLSEANESEEDSSDIDFRKASMTSLLSHMTSHKIDNNNKANGYGAITKCIEVSA